MRRGSSLIVGLDRGHQYEAQHFQYCGSQIPDGTAIPSSTDEVLDRSSGSQHTYIGILRQDNEAKHLSRPELDSLAGHLYAPCDDGLAALNGRQVTLLLPEQWCGCNRGKHCPFSTQFTDKTRDLFVAQVYDAAGGASDMLGSGDETAEKSFRDLYDKIHFVTRQEFLASPKGHLLNSYLSANTYTDQMQATLTARGVPISKWWQQRNTERDPAT
jgi:hypothetical protein